MIKSQFFWLSLIGLIVCVDFVAFGYLIARSSTDESFAVEENYYEIGLEWDAHMAQERENARLGWRVEVSVGDIGHEDRSLNLRVTDREGAPIPGARLRADAFANRKASEKHERTCVTDSQGLCEIRVPETVGGIWDVRLRVVDADGQVFTNTARVYLPLTRGGA